MALAGGILTSLAITVVTQTFKSLAPPPLKQLNTEKRICRKFRTSAFIWKPLMVHNLSSWILPCYSNTQHKA